MRPKKKALLILLGTPLLLLAVFVLVLIAVSVEQNKTVQLSSYTVTHEEIPASFEGKRIMQLSDLHNKDFKEQLTQLVKEQEPDVIVITGDWISRNSENIEVAERQAQALVSIAPVFYIPGNHEGRSPLYAELYRSLRASGVTVLDRRTVEWTVNGETVEIVGITPPEFGTFVSRDLPPLIDAERYSILLMHHPDAFLQAVEGGADLVLSGHTHGGQIRLPWIGAVYAPDQGLFPTYDVGCFEKDGATMIVSQGLGEAWLMRILTPPEAVLITLDSPYAE